MSTRRTAHAPHPFALHVRLVGVLAALIVGAVSMTVATPAGAVTPDPEPGAQKDSSRGTVSQSSDSGWVYQGDDFAFFDFDGTDSEVIVCDKEADGHAVYAYLRYSSDMTGLSLYDNTPGCTTHSIEGASKYRYVTVCESVWGPDWCA